jgi:hypothetical protein
VKILNDTQTVGEVLSNSLSSLYERLINFLPELIVAVIVLVLGWAVAILLGSVVGKILRAIKVDDLADRLGLAKLSDRVGKKLTISGFGHWLVKWFIIVAIFVAAAEILGLEQVGEFLFGSVVPFFGNVIIAGAILVIGLVAANFVQDLLTHSLNATGLKNVHSVATIARWAVIIFAFLAALTQLGVASALIQDLFRAIVAMLAIAGGIAFGLGGRDHAKQTLDKMSNNLK